MRLPGVRTKIRSLSIAIAIAAVAMAYLRSGSRLHLISNEQAVEIATALVMQGDPSFRPEKHKARVYRECSTSPLVVDLYSETDTSVVKRVWFTNRGVIEGPKTFKSDENVESSRYGPGMYVLDRRGMVIGLAPYIIGPDGEVVGLAPLVPASKPSPQLQSGGDERYFPEGVFDHEDKEFEMRTSIRMELNTGLIADGDHLICEGVKGGKYHIVDRSDPEPDYEGLSRLILGLSGLDISEAWAAYHGEAEKGSGTLNKGS